MPHPRGRQDPRLGDLALRSGGPAGSRAALRRDEYREGVDDDEVEEGDVPGVVVARVNASPRFVEELIAALQDTWSKFQTTEGIRNLPEAPDLCSSRRPTPRDLYSFPTRRP